MTNKNDTVTSSLETYEEMKAEIKFLKPQVQENTIIRNALPPIYGYIIAALLCSLMDGLKVAVKPLPQPQKRPLLL